MHLFSPKHALGARLSKAFRKKKKMLLIETVLRVHFCLRSLECVLSTGGRRSVVKLVDCSATAIKVQHESGMFLHAGK